MTWIALGLGVVATLLALTRWLRVSQREHYIAGSCLTTARRWTLRRPPNLPVMLLAVTGTAATVTTSVLDEPDIAAGIAIATALAIAVFPWPMPVLGTPRLKFTRRATTLSLIAVIITTLVGVAVGVGAGWPAGAVVAAVLTPALVDIAAAIVAPLERRAADKHRQRAAARLAQVSPFVIAVTGSFGKTSTKNHIRDLVAGTAEVVASPASWNNTAGLSRTMNEHLTDTTEVLVAEMGTYGPGEIRDMCSWVRPDVAIICAIGPMHLERMGSIEGIVTAKSEILERADTAVLWVDDPNLATLADTTPVPRIIRVGTRGGRGLDIEVETSDDTVTIWENGDVVGTFPLALGAHPSNVGCAVAAARAYGVPIAKIAERLPQLTNPSHRATAATSDAGVLVIDDTFNSNPAGARAAVDRLAESVDGKRAVVTPGMVELGPIQDRENEALANAVVESGATLVIVGRTNRTALRRGGGSGVVTVRNRDAARAWVRANLGQGDGVLWENDLPDHYP